MVDYITASPPHIIGTTESWAYTDLNDAQLGLEDCVMFRKYSMGRRLAVVLSYVKYTIPADEVQRQEEADSEEALRCKLVTGHNNYNGSSLSLSKHNNKVQWKNKIKSE